MAGADDIEGLVFRCLELREAEGPEAVEAFLDERPDLAPAIRERLDALARSGLIRGSSPQTDFPESLGDFRLLEPLGGGGMGIVYRAIQESLDREVALKLIRPEQLYFPGARERFEREVEIVARLHHPGIVPVFTFGEEGGVPYFAMERVDGCTLAAALDQLEGRDPGTLAGADLAAAIARAVGGDAPAEPAPLFRAGWVDLCLTIVREVAEALEHAHRLGVLHRDLKPSNVMITLGGRVMLLDFGLSASESTDRLTRTGSQIGSLPYLPPERVSHDAPFDRSSDVYGLGVTLYELLTLRLPFEGRTAPELMSSIASGGAVPIRRRNPRVSWDAETVCQVAMETHAGRRYASADALARDLTNVLERRPISARRTGPVRRASRWVQRHPGWAAALLLATLGVTVGPSVLALQKVRAAERLGRESQLAADSLARSLVAVNEMLVVLGGHDIRNVPHLERKREELLERALELYQEIEAALGASEGDGLALVLREQMIDAQVTLASVYTLLGRPEDGETTYRQAIDRAERELAADATNTFVRERLAMAHQGLGELLSVKGEHDAGAEARRAGIGVLLDAGAQGIGTAELASALFGLRLALSNDLWRTGQADEAIELLRSILAESEGDATELDRVAARTSLGTFLYWSLRLDEAEPVLLEAVAGAEVLLETTAEMVQAKELLSNASSNLAATLLASLPMRADEAEVHFARAAEMQRDLSVSFPAAPEYASGLATALMNHGNCLNYVEGRRTEGYATTERARPILADLAQRYPEDLELVSSYGHCLAVLGGLSVDLGHEARADGDEERAAQLYERSLPWFEQATATLSSVLDRRPGNPETVGLQRNALGAWAAGLIARGRHAEAAERVRAGMALPHHGWRNARGDAGRFLMCAAITEEGSALQAAYVDEAMETLQLAVELGYRDLGDLLGTPLLEPLRSHPEFPALRARVEQD